MATATRFNDLVACSGEEELEGRIHELLSNMSLNEKIGQMVGDTSLPILFTMIFRYGWRTFDSGANRRLGIPSLRFSDGPRGVNLNHSTCFPVAMARGATWDPGLAERVGSAIGIEARSQGSTFSGSICVNLLRHPGWGRAQETFGEDPHHLGVMGVAALQGTQRHLMACVKHFACNSIEESRFFVDVLVSERTLREIYLPHFKRCVDAGAASVMSAYNRVNGEYCGHNARLLRDILKDEWGFDGPVMSDFVWGVRDGAAGVRGGLDMEMPKKWRFGLPLRRAVKRGLVKEEMIDDAAARVLRVKARFARVGEEGVYGPERVACREHVDLALEAARKGIVLLKNEGGTLPLDRAGVSCVAVIGGLADTPNIGDRGSSRVEPPYVVTPFQGIRNKAGDGVKVELVDGLDVAQARRLARRADASIVVVGLTCREEGEFMSSLAKAGGDRVDLGLKEEDQALIKAVAEEAGRCIVVLEGGSAITMEGWDDQVESILMAWYPGMEGGNAIAEILFGDVNPSGRLPVTFPVSARQLPHFDKKAKSIEYGYYHGYRHFDHKGLDPAYPFGFGLSYTRFEYSSIKVSAEEIPGDGKLQVVVVLANVGDRTGEETVQVYAGFPATGVERHVRELKAFQRVELGPGEAAEILFEIEAADLARYDEPSAAWVVDAGEYMVYAGPSSRESDLGLRAAFRVS